MSIDYKPEQNDYKNLTPFKSWLLLQINTWGQNNFPFVESDFDELTNYGMMQKLMKAVNDVISNENLVEEDMSNLFNAFGELQTYINNYFDNLDVQEEIDIKLDEMAEDGSLTNLIKAYIDPIYQAYENSINNQLNNVNNDINNINNDINVLESRMDTFTHLTDGSTSGDAELEDIRIGYQGYTESSAGNSVRKQTSQLRNIHDNYTINNLNQIKGIFRTGNANAQGIFDNITYRVRTNEKIKYPYDIKVKQTYDIYTITAVIYNNYEDTTGRTPTLRGGYYQIPANTYFMLSIKLTTEDTSITPNLYDFSSACKYISETKNNFDNIGRIATESLAKSNKKIDSNIYTLSELEGDLTTGSYITYSNGSEYASQFGCYKVIETGFNDGDIIRINGRTANNLDYPACFFVDENEQTLMVIRENVNTTYENYETFIPYGCKKIYINGSLNPEYPVTPSAYLVSYDTSIVKPYPLNIADALIRESKKNPFAFSSFNKGYISFIFDDTRTDMDLVASIFAEYNFPLCLATIPSELNKLCSGLSETSQGYTPSMTRKQVCERVVSLGGEILSHSTNVITLSNQYDYDFMYNYFVNTKEMLEYNGFKIRGLIRAGGSGAITGTEEIEKWLIGNYEYSNQGTAVNYSQDRENITTNMSLLKSHILNAYNNNEWIKIMGHGISETTSGNNISESDLREILDYCENLGIEVVTYAYIFDNFSSSQFLNSI